jgi:hypothetical protein
MESNEHLPTSSLRIVMRRRIEGRRRPLTALLIGLTIAAGACGKPEENQASTTDGAGGESQVAAASPSRPDTSIIVNGVVLPEETVQQLQQIYPVPIPPGRYWYDAISGAYGREGEPIAGQMIPGLSLGGALAEDASRGASGVFINGRQLTAGETAYIEQLCQTPVVLGRYWVIATGVGGFEGQPASFNLAQCPGVPRQGGGSGSSTRTYCDANGACTSTGVLGSILTAPN